MSIKPWVTLKWISALPAAVVVLCLIEALSPAWCVAAAPKLRGGSIEISPPAE